MAGEDEESDDPNAFHKKPAWQRFIITAAGATVNIVAGFLAMIIIVACSDIGSTTYAEPIDRSVIIEAYQDSEDIEVDTTYSSAEYGLLPGDNIISVNGKKVRIEDELSYQISRYGHEPVDLVVIRDGERVELNDVRFPIATSQDQVFGVQDFRVYRAEKTFFKIFPLSVRKSALVMRMCWESIIDLISGRYNFKAVMGPVGISVVISDAAKVGFLSFLNIVVLISMNLGFMNLIPFPALDGGGLLTILIEMVTRKKIPPNIEGIINAIGLAILFTLMIVILFTDTFRLIF